MDRRIHLKLWIWHGYLDNLGREGPCFTASGSGQAINDHRSRFKSNKIMYVIAGIIAITVFR